MKQSLEDLLMKVIADIFMRRPNTADSGYPFKHLAVPGGKPAEAKQACIVTDS